MIASNIERRHLEAAASECGLELQLSQLSDSGKRWRVKVNPGTPPHTVWSIDPRRKRSCPDCGVRQYVTLIRHTGQAVGQECGHTDSIARWAGYRRWKDERGDAPYQRISSSAWAQGERRVYAVCWHGFRDFFRAAFKHQPDARFYTAFDKWIGSEDFEERYRDSGHRNIGSKMFPMAAAEACRCPENGSAR